jgi:hypothetical protein
MKTEAMLSGGRVIAAIHSFFLLTATFDLSCVFPGPKTLARYWRMGDLAREIRRAHFQSKNGEKLSATTKEQLEG